MRGCKCPCMSTPSPITAGATAVETAATGGGSVIPGLETVDSALLSEVVKRLPQAIALRDDQGQILFANEAALRNFGADDVCRMTHQRAGDNIDGRRNAPTVFEFSSETSSGRRDFLITQTAFNSSNRNLLLSSAVDISEQARREASLVRLAYFDELTGLPNRRVIESRVEAAQRTQPNSRFALAFLDLDNFKQINDYYGHAVGDALLTAFAQRIGFYLRSSDMLARISGDEFLLLLDPVQSEQEVRTYFEAMLEKLKAPYVFEGAEVFGSVSVGIALYPDHGQSYKALRQNADIAMYQVKSSTKGSFAFFDNSMEHEVQERMKTEQALRLAIQDRHFVCAFQPKVDIRTREIKGVEALVRLRDEHGVIQAPGAFVDLAVELGLIDNITHLVLDEIMKSIDLIDERFGPEVSISINVAAKQAVNVDFMTSFARALAATGCAERFVVEVTEDAFVTKTQVQTEILPILRRIGVGISIDDFGVGYSSLSALADITADEIKIDRSFITNIHKRPRSQGILKAIESLSEALGMTVIAEGVESFEELAYLQAATRIRYAQGYYFSQPIFLDEMKVTHQPSASQAEQFNRQPLQTRSAAHR